ncbi:MAG: carbonic anhydrase family protein [Vicinamibacterales bacterium]|nr:carbonic anhydrase family protein [Vicinamibacterales bacterium]
MKAHTSETQATITPVRALEFLREGNLRFINNLRVNRNLLQMANETRDGQWPFATIVSCIDSRTSAELIFDQGLGDIFSVRIAGNVINTDILGSLEFACSLAGSRLIVVLGHSSCGAVKGACDHVEMGNLTELLSKIQPAVYEENDTPDRADRHSHNPAFVENVAALNVRRSVRTIVNRSHSLKQLIDRGALAIIGAKHDLATGLVDFYADTWMCGHQALQPVLAPEAAVRLTVGARPSRRRASLPPRRKARPASPILVAEATPAVPHLDEGAG